MSNTRERVLTAVRAASEAMPTTSFSRNYRTSLEPSDSILELFIDRLLDYRATVIDLRLEVDADKIRAEIEAVLAERDIASVAVPVGLPDGLRPTCVPVVEDRGLTNSELDLTGASLTESAISVALSGTILLDHAGNQGRRALTLIPDTHICLVHIESIVGTLPEAIAKLGPRKVMTWISGPSATSDIELVRVEGVHGPRNLIVLLHALNSQWEEKADAVTYTG